MPNNIEGIATGFHEEIPDFLKCEIEDTYILDLKHATLIRKITYENISDKKTTQVDIPDIPHYFSQYCSDFSCSIQNVNCNYDPPQNHNYAKTITIKTEPRNLSPHEKLELKIECKWKNFINFLDDCYIGFSYSQSTYYSLIIKGYNISDRKYKILLDDKIIEAKDISIKDDQIEIFPNKDRLLVFGESINIRLLVVKTPDRLKSFHSLYKDGDNSFNNYIIILIQHLLGDFIHLLEKLVEYGAMKENIIICGIPYSTKEATKEYIKLCDYPNIYTPDEYPFTDTVINIIRKGINLAKETHKDILVIEDGGYIFPLLYDETEFVSGRKYFKFIVEQTTNGINNDKLIVKKYSLKENIPIINVAESELKKELESILIGRTVAKNIEQLLNKEFTGLEDKEIGIVGYGNIGENIISNLLNRGARVKIFDINDKGKIKAKFGGSVKVVDSIPEVIKESDILIEASGNPEAWAHTHELSLIKNASYFLSSSSKRLGISYSDLKNYHHKSINLPGIGKKYFLNNENYTTFLADGYPINFFLGESVPDKQIQFILTLLFGAAHLAINKINSLDNSIIDMQDKEDKFGFKALQDVISKNYIYTKT